MTETFGSPGGVPAGLTLLRLGADARQSLQIVEYTKTTGEVAHCLMPEALALTPSNVEDAIGSTLDLLEEHGSWSDLTRECLGLVPATELAGSGCDPASWTEVRPGWFLEGTPAKADWVESATPLAACGLSELQVRRIRDAFASPEESPHALGRSLLLWTDPDISESATRGDLLLDCWRLHLVRPGQAAEDFSPWAYPREDAEGHGHGLPLVELWDISGFDALEPEGTYVASRHMSELLGMDGQEPLSEGSGLASFGSATLRPHEAAAIAEWLDDALEDLVSSPENPPLCERVAAPELLDAPAAEEPALDPER